MLIDRRAGAEPVHKAAAILVAATSALPASAACTTLSDDAAMDALGAKPLQADGNAGTRS
jgi:hypothetical protein